MTRIGCTLLVLLLGCTPVIAGDHAEGYTGEVLINSRDGAVMILVDTFKEKRDGLVDQWFTLQTDDGGAVLSEHLGVATVVHASGYLRVISAEHQTVYEFAVPGNERTEALPEGFTVVRREGYGLARNAGPTNVRIGKLRERGITIFECTLGCDPIYPDFGDYGGGGYTACMSGGPGSVSCSVTHGELSCNVTCGQGTYSCCNFAPAPNCRCVKN